MLPASLVLKQGDWYTWDIIARDTEIRILLEGMELLKYEEPIGEGFTYGRLALFCAGNAKGGTVARATNIRKLEVRRLP